jgi:hypothetical protein
MRITIITTIVAGLVATTSIQPSFAARAPGIGASSAGTIGSASGLGNAAGTLMPALGCQTDMPSGLADVCK